MGLEPTNLLTASQALYQLSYAPEARGNVTRCLDASRTGCSDQLAAMPATTCRQRSRGIWYGA